MEKTLHWWIGNAVFWKEIVFMYQIFQNGVCCDMEEIAHKKQQISHISQNQYSLRIWRTWQLIYQDKLIGVFVFHFLRITESKFFNTEKKNVTPQIGQVFTICSLFWGVKLQKKRLHIMFFLCPLSTYYCGLRRWLLEDEAERNPKSANIKLLQVFLHKYDCII